VLEAQNVHINGNRIRFERDDGVHEFVRSGSRYKLDGEGHYILGVEVKNYSRLSSDEKRRIFWADIPLPEMSSAQ
jgi:hypothetical protein